MAYNSVLTGTVKIEDLVFETVALAPGAAGTITNSMVSPSAAIATSKQVNRVQANYSQADNSNVASTSGDGVAVYICDKADGATIKKVSALCQDVGASGAPAHNIEIDVKRYDYSGTSLASVLSAAFSITESEADYETVNGTLSVTDMDQGDVLVVTVTVTGSGGTAPQGLLVQVEIDEEGS